jgi:nicotinate-nucleotide adenylyltransferase
MINGIERVGIYGGTFAPIHNGHITAAKAFLEQMKLDKLIIIPALIPPHKSIDTSDNPHHRFRMCELAFEGMANIQVSDIELKRIGPSYTVDTLRQLTAEGRKLFLLCGTDMMLTFDKWREFKEIFKLCCPIYMRRENDSENDNLIISKNKAIHFLVVVAQVVA